MTTLLLTARRLSIGNRRLSGRLRIVIIMVRGFDDVHYITGRCEAEGGRECRGAHGRSADATGFRGRASRRYVRPAASVGAVLY